MKHTKGDKTITAYNKFDLEGNNEYLQDKDFPFSVTEDQFLDLD